MKVIKVYHTQANEGRLLKFPSLSEGTKQWLGNGYYFWQDYEFSEWWGDDKKCKKWNISRKYDIYEVELKFSEEDFIDTVFNETDYYNFIKSIEKFAKAYQKREKKKPTLEEFNLFIKRFKIWDNIKVIRFQDIPKNNYFLEVNGFYYKKRIQIRVNKPNIISNFAHLITKDCVG